MNALLKLSRAIDWTTSWLGRSAAWLIIAAALVSAGNALSRKLFDASNNSWLELQWWLFSIAFLLAAPWTLAQNEHIRIDILNAKFPAWLKHTVEIVGITLFLIPITLVLVATSWPYFTASYAVSEQSSNFGGLPVYPIKLLIPVAFALLFVQAISELIKRVAIIQGIEPEFLGHGHHPRASEAEAERVRSQMRREPPEPSNGSTP